MARTRRELIESGAGVLAVATLAGCLEGDGDSEAADGSDDHDDGHDDDHDHGHDDDDDHDHGHDDDHDHDDDHMEIAKFEVIDRSHDEVTTYVHGDHWHDELPHVEEGEHISLGAYVEDDHGDEIQIGSDEKLELRARVADGAAADVVEFDYHGDHVHIIGEEVGITDVVFQLWHDDHADYETPEATVQVVEHGHDDDHDDHDHGTHVEDLEIIDRSDDEVVADVHDDHWDGELPVIPVDDNISLGARFLDDHDEEIAIGSDEQYQFRVRLADDAEAGVVEFDYHGDHVHIIGEEGGETEAVFQLWHDDHADYESSSIEAVVEE